MKFWGPKFQDVQLANWRPKRGDEWLQFASGGLRIGRVYGGSSRANTSGLETQEEPMFLFNSNVPAQ